MPKSKKIESDDLDRREKGSNVKRLSFSLPLPPSVNHMYYAFGRGGKRLTPKAEAWIKYARKVATEEVAKQKWKMEYKGKWVVCEMVFWFPDKRIRDNHNSFKCLFDALEGVLYENDMYVLPRVMYVGLDREHPRIEVTFLP